MRMRSHCFGLKSNSFQQWCFCSRFKHHKYIFIYFPALCFFFFLFSIVRRCSKCNFIWLKAHASATKCIHIKNSRAQRLRSFHFFSIHFRCAMVVVLHVSSRCCCCCRCQQLLLCCALFMKLLFHFNYMKL